MLFLTTITTLITAVAGAAVDNTPAVFDKRTSAPARVRVWTSGGCDSSPIYDNNYTPGSCSTISSSSATYGVQVNNPNQVCVFKFWQNSDCSGKATTWAIQGAKDTGCFPLANQGGNFVLTSGAKSFFANCAMDTK